MAACLIGAAGCDALPKSGFASMETVDIDAIVVGGGIAGLAAALELGQGGAEVLILDMNSVAGGHAVKAGGWALVDTPLQQKRGIEDSPELAFNDLMVWGETNDREWTRFYVEHSREMVYDWLVGLGVEFALIIPTPEHSVPRFHFTRGTSVNVVAPILRNVFRYENIKFLGNSRADGLVMDDGRVNGVVAEDLRTGQRRTFAARAVVIATGGFQGNPELVRETWRGNISFPGRMLIGAGRFATGGGHALAEQAGASLIDLEKHATFINGLPDPRDGDGRRALVADNPLAIWVNAEGERFTDETRADKFNVPAVLQQSGGTYWAIFDARGRKKFSVRDALWLDKDTIQNEIVDNGQIVKTAASLDALARSTGLPRDALDTTISRYNEFIERGVDKDFARPMTVGRGAPQKIETPPFYAVQLFPVTRKSMGGIAVDMGLRALDAGGEPIPGLYAAGEVTGAVGINGSVGMSGTFLGPSLMTGRIAGRTALEELDVNGNTYYVQTAFDEVSESWQPDFTRDDLVALLEEPRPGYWHFEAAHALVLERGDQCTQCHSASVPMQPATTRRHLRAQTEICTQCHR